MKDGNEIKVMDGVCVAGMGSKLEYQTPQNTGFSNPPKVVGFNFHSHFHHLFYKTHVHCKTDCKPNATLVLGLCLRKSVDITTFLFLL